MIDDTRNWLDQWCAKYLGMPLDDIELEQLLDDEDVRLIYLTARRASKEGQHQKTLELLGRGLYIVMIPFSRLGRPRIGKPDVEDALKLAAFGVRPTDFLTLQEFIPRVVRDLKTGSLEVLWDSRGTGNPANWTEENVTFCLDTFLDIALKVQHAQLPPSAVEFPWVFDDVVSPGNRLSCLGIRWKVNGPSSGSLAGCL